MKNIKFGDVVPVKLRYAVYRKAIRTIRANKPVWGMPLKTFQLCTLLPCILYRKAWLTLFSMPGAGWTMTHRMFPEIKEWVKTCIYEDLDPRSPETDRLRIEVLGRAIKSLHNEKR